MQKKATVELPPQKRPGAEGLTLVPRGAAGPGVVSQMRLARIQHLQAEVAFYEMELAKEWESVRTDLLGGASVEKGPLRAWIKCILRLGRAKTIDAPRKVAKTLMVR